MDNLKICKNNCIFCFVKQLPVGLRESLYIKDDDYIESYTNGNFITLTNLGRKEIDRIIKFKIEPLHVSLHSFDKNIRNILFGNNKNEKAVKIFEFLDKNSVRTNIQIVLCPGINDGKDLASTLDILINDFNNVLSIGLVPVGITKYNKCSRLISYDFFLSKNLIDFINDFKKLNKKNKKSKTIYLSDEFYLLAKKELPSYRQYGRFLQIKNGIGKTADFLKEFKNSFQKYADINNVQKLLNKSTLIVTSEYGKDVIEIVLNEIFEIVSSFENFCGTVKKIKNKIDILPVKNDFLGGNVKVTGLLAGNDIIKKLRIINKDAYNKILIPGSIFNINGLTIDNCSRRDILNKGKNNIIICEEEGKELARQILI